MYPMHKKAGARAEETVSEKDCFANKVKNWLWIMGIIAVGAIVCTIITFSGEKAAYSSTGQSFSQGGQFENVALTRCPYCPGLLDAQRRCDVRGCPIYSPNWGKPSNLQNIPLKRVLIKELALEVSALEDNGSVTICSLYGSGGGKKAGLWVADRIRRFNGRRVKNVKQFQSIVAKAKPASDVKIQVIRNKKKIELVVRIGEGQIEGVTLPKTMNPA